MNQQNQPRGIGTSKTAKGTYTTVERSQIFGSIIVSQIDLEQTTRKDLALLLIICTYGKTEIRHDVFAKDKFG